MVATEVPRGHGQDEQEGRLFFLGCNISIGRGIKQLNENAKWKSV